MKNIAEIKLKKKENKALYEFKRRVLEKFPTTEIILDGSKAREDYDEFSDMDLLILVEFELNRDLREEIGEVKYEIELKYDVVFGLIIENKNFWGSSLAKAMPLHWNIDREGATV